MPTQIIKESQLRKIFKGCVLEKEAIEYLDDSITQRLEEGAEGLRELKINVNKEIMKLIYKGNALIVVEKEEE